MRVGGRREGGRGKERNRGEKRSGGGGGVLPAMEPVPQYFCWDTVRILLFPSLQMRHTYQHTLWTPVKLVVRNTCFSWTERRGNPICLVHVLITEPTGLPLDFSKASQRSSEMWW